MAYALASHGPRLELNILPFSPWTARSSSTFLSGFVLTVTPGKVGEVFKSLVLFETYRVPVARTAPIVVAERVTDVIGIVMLIVARLARFLGRPDLGGLGTVAVVMLLVVVGSTRLSLALIGRLERLPGPFRRIGPKLHDAYESLATLVRPSNLVIPTCCRSCAWSLECIALWVILRGFSASKRPLGLAAFFYATSTLAGALVPVPGASESPRPRSKGRCSGSGT